jgi:aarF domain-containing kinase
MWRNVTFSAARWASRSAASKGTLAGVAFTATGASILKLQVYCDSVAITKPGSTDGPAVVKKRAPLAKGSAKAAELAKVVTGKPDSILEYIKRFYRKMKEMALVLWRSLFLTTMLLPVGLTIPLALQSNAQISDWWWSYLRASIRSCGPCLTKFAQWMATRPDIWGSEVCDRMRDLQSSKSFLTSAATIEQVLDQEFGSDWTKHIELQRIKSDSILGSDELEVIGAGCVAQVIKGTMIETGEVVALKIVHPGIKGSIQADIDIMKFVAYMIETVPSLQNFAIMDSVEEFATFMLSQLNFRNEGVNLEKFRKNFRVEEIEKSGLAPKVNFPKPFMDFASENVLVESFDDGVLVSALFDEDKELRKEVADIALHALLKMVFDDNFIHGGMSFFF